MSCSSFALLAPIMKILQVPDSQVPKMAARAGNNELAVILYQHSFDTCRLARAYTRLCTLYISLYKLVQAYSSLSKLI
eukprot:226237-Alexandrium_andersonii.AAC.1